MNVRLRWAIFVIICVAGIGFLWYRQASRNALFQQAASDNTEISRRATETLLDKKIIPAALGAQPSAVRIALSRSLGEIGNETALSILTGLLSDSDEKVRTAAREALVKIGQPALPELAKTLSSSDENAGKMTIQAFVEIGPQAVPQLEKALTDAASQQNASLALGEIASKYHSLRNDALAPLLKAVGGEDLGLAKAAIAVLGNQKVEAAVPTLLKALGKEEFRKDAIIALGEIGDARATPALLPFISQSAYRMETVQALGQIGDARAAAPLAATLSDPNYDYRSALILALQRIGAPAAATLTAYLHSGNVEVRRAAAEALQVAHSPNAIPALQQALHDNDSQVRAAAAAALGWPGNMAGVPALISALYDNDDEVVNAAVAALAEIGPQTIPALLSLFSSSNPTFAYLASRSLEKMNGPAVAPLLSALDNAPSQKNLWITITLGEIGDKRALGSLRSLQTNSTGNLQWAAGQAIDKIPTN